MLPQRHVQDPDHSARSAGGRLHLNTHTPVTQQSQDGLTMPLCRHSVGIYQKMSSHATHHGTLGQSSQLAEHCWVHSYPPPRNPHPQRPPVPNQPNEVVVDFKQNISSSPLYSCWFCLQNKTVLLLCAALPAVVSQGLLWTLSLIVQTYVPFLYRRYGLPTTLQG